jgi:C1A family cysteine protease
MQKQETKNLKINRVFTSDSNIPINDINSISSLSISGEIKLIDNSSLVRVILLTKLHEYLIYEAYPLIKNSKEFVINKVCEETSLIDNEIPIELTLVVRNAQLRLNQIHFSDIKLTDNEKFNLSNLKNSHREHIVKCKSSEINNKNNIKNRNWIAGATELSMLSFEDKKNLWSADNDFLSGGFEYYIDGIFSLEDTISNKNKYLKSTTTSNYVSEFDWRNRHGQNWNTSVKNQGYSCGSCWAFAAVAVTEAMTNIYYNNPNIDLDLSEQDLVSCSSSGNCSGGYFSSALEYIRDNGIVDENCFPYSATNESCSNKCQNPNETVRVESVHSSINGYDNIKSALINHGPLASGFWFSTGGGHAMELCGYKTIKAGDIIRYVNNNGYGIDSVIQAGNSLIGQLYWVFKNSYGVTGRPNNGYMYLFLNNPSSLISGSYVSAPYSTSSYIRNCTDNDHDGYYWWGIGNKPASCPTCAPDTPDGDDSNPNIGPMDIYGNCSSISSPYTYPAHEVTSTEIWQSITTECGNVVVKNNGNLTINGATVNLEGDAEFSVEIGGTFIFNNGVIQ